MIMSYLSKVRERETAANSQLFELHGDGTIWVLHRTPDQRLADAGQQPGDYPYHGEPRGDGVSAGWELRSDAEDSMDELALRDRIALGDPSDLTFADCMHRLVAFDGSTGTLRRSKAEARGNPLLYETMVLFDEVV